MKWWLTQSVTVSLGVVLTVALGVGSLFGRAFFSLKAIILEIEQTAQVPPELSTQLTASLNQSSFWLGLTLGVIGLLVGMGILKLNWDAYHDQKKQQELQTTATIYRRAVLEAPIPVMLHAEDGEVLQISRAWTELTGYAETDIPTIADWAEQAYGAAQKAAVQADIANLYQLKRRVDEGEYAILTRDGGVRIWSFFSAPLGSLADHRQIVNSTAIDITHFQPVEAALYCIRDEIERRVAEQTQQLEQANKALETFAYTVAHDLYAPLRTIQRYTQILLEDQASPLNATEAESLQRIYSAAQRMEGFIRDLLAYSRLSRPNLMVQPVNLKAVIAQALTDLEESLQQHRVVVEVREPLAIVQAHPTVLAQAISNLLSNAIKFTQPDRPPQISLWLEDQPEQNTVRLYVQDNGIGIAPADQQRIFDVFERVYPADLYAGNGIGLALVQRAMERMNGTVGVESQPGEGSRFWLEMPKVTESARE